MFYFIVIFDWFVLSMRMQVILDFPGLLLDSLFRPPGFGSAPVQGGKKGEFGDWTIKIQERLSGRRVNRAIKDKLSSSVLQHIKGVHYNSY